MLMICCLFFIVARAAARESHRQLRWQRATNWSGDGRQFRFRHRTFPLEPNDGVASQTGIHVAHSLQDKRAIGVQEKASLSQE